MRANPFDRLDRLYVLTVPANTRTAIPYMGTDGRLEVFTDRELAASASAWLEEKMHIRTEVRMYEERDTILDFFRSCMHNGMIVFRLNNGSDAMREYKLDDLFSFREPNLPEEINRTVRYYLIRSKEYAYYRACLPEEERSAKQGISLAEMELTTLYNAYREMYRGVLYALTARASGDDLDRYTLAALDRAKTLLKEKPIAEAGYTAVSLIHKPHQGGMLCTAPLSLCYLNSPGQVGNAAEGLICAFTSYEAAEYGKAQFESCHRPCSVVALTAQELMAEAQQCAGVLIDMGDTEYQIPSRDFALWKTYGELDAPIIVSLKARKETAEGEAASLSDADAAVGKEEGVGQ